MTDHYDVPEAAAAERYLRGRQYAALELIAFLTGETADRTRIITDYTQAGLRNEVRAAKLELDRVYRIGDRNPDDALADLRAMLNPHIDDGPQLRNDVRRGTVEDCPDDGLEWPS